MKRIASSLMRGFQFGILLGLAACTALNARTATASLQLAISPSPISAAAGSSGDAFDVTLTNSGPSAVSISGFAFELSVSSSYISLTQATTATTSSPYIFAGSSFFGPTISFSPPALPGQTIQAEDLTSLLSGGAAVGSGVTVGLGHVLFNVASNAPTSSVAVTLSPFPPTNLTDDSGADITNEITSVSSATINIQGTSPTVPEPSMFAIFAIGSGLAFVAGIARVRMTLTAGGRTS